MRRAAGDWRVFLSQNMLSTAMYFCLWSSLRTPVPLHLVTGPLGPHGKPRLSAYSGLFGQRWVPFRPPPLSNFRVAALPPAFTGLPAPPWSQETRKKGEPWEPGMTVEGWFRVPQFNKQDFHPLYRIPPWTRIFAVTTNILSHLFRTPKTRTYSCAEH